MNLTAYSKAGYANWYYFEGLKLLIDAGEGVNERLEGRAFRIQEVLLSHSHTDHTAGLFALIDTRAVEVQLRDRELPPLRLLYPEGATELERWLDALAGVVPDFEALIERVPVVAGQEVTSAVRDDIRFGAVGTHHRDDEPCLAWRISQRRQRLRPEFSELTGEDLRDLAKERGREHLSHIEWVPLIYYSGDGPAQVDEASRGVDLLMHEATFLAPDSSPNHSTLQEALEVSRALGARQVLISHISSRYEPEAIRAALEAARREDETVWLVEPDALFEDYVPIRGL